MFAKETSGNDPVSLLASEPDADPDTTTVDVAVVEMSSDGPDAGLCSDGDGVVNSCGLVAFVVEAPVCPSARSDPDCDEDVAGNGGNVGRLGVSAGAKSASIEPDIVLHSRGVVMAVEPVIEPDSD